jgi:hypothetical protein
MTHLYSSFEPVPLLKAVGWRGAQAQGNGAFRINGTYDAPADTRPARRKLDREAAKAQRKRGEK